MKASDLKEAEGIVAAVKRLKEFERMLPYGRAGFGAINLAGPDFNPQRNTATQIPLTEQAAAAALVAMRQQWKDQMAKYRRRAAQIGLSLED